MIAYSYMGGLDGLAITRKILAQIAWNCIMYFIVMGEEGLQQLIKEITSETHFSNLARFAKRIELMQQAQFYNEHLFVVKLKL